MSETYRAEDENCEMAGAWTDDAFISIEVYHPARRGGCHVIQKFSATMKERDGSRPAARPAGFVLSFQRTPDCFDAGSVVIKTYVEHFREVCLMPEGVEGHGLALRQVDEPGILLDVRTGRLVSPAIIAEQLQRPPFACPTIAMQLRMQELIREARKGGSPS
jgi:hypothetical protein